MLDATSSYKIMDRRIPVDDRTGRRIVPDTHSRAELVATLHIARFWGLEPSVAEVEEIAPTPEIPERVEIPTAETPVFTPPKKTGILAKLWKGIKRIVSRK